MMNYDGRKRMLALIDFKRAEGQDPVQLVLYENVATTKFLTSSGSR